MQAYENELIDNSISNKYEAASRRPADLGEVGSSHLPVLYAYQLFSKSS